MARERTFLARLRTGVTLVALGLGAAQFLEKNLTPGEPLMRAMCVALVAFMASIIILLLRNN